MLLRAFDNFSGAYNIHNAICVSTSIFINLPLQKDRQSRHLLHQNHDRQHKNNYHIGLLIIHKHFIVHYNYKDYTYFVIGQLGQLTIFKPVTIIIIKYLKGNMP